VPAGKAASTIAKTAASVSHIAVLAMRSPASAASDQPIMMTPPTDPNTIAAWLNNGSGISSAIGCSSPKPMTA
jgi:hypothetical protein